MYVDIYAYGYTFEMYLGIYVYGQQIGRYIIQMYVPHTMWVFMYMVSR